MLSFDIKKILSSNSQLKLYQEFEYHGDLNLLDKKYKKVCIVGSRKMSSYGKLLIDEVVPKLLAKDVVIVSGGAFGVDIYSHKVCNTFDGKAIAVLPSNLKNIYPKLNAKEINKITKNGLLISTSKNSSPKKYDFIYRNQVMSEISDLTLIIEASENSGSRHTANFTIDLNKPLACFPGNIFSPIIKLNHKLIKQGAYLVESADDILELLG